MKDIKGLASFQVLRREQQIHRNYLLEASAGTGKTFSIENIVVRLLIEGEALPLEKILVVTFTKLATSDLRMRVRKNIEMALHLLKKPFADEKVFIPDYLLAILEQGQEVLTKAVKRLEIALNSFDQAQIFTIHSFCARMLKMHLLEGDVAFAVTGLEEEKELQSSYQQVVRDFFRTEVREESYSFEQLNILLREHGSVEGIEEAIIRLIKRSIAIGREESLEEQLCVFYAEMAALRGILEPASLYQASIVSKLLEDFALQAPAYEKLCDRKKQVKPEVLEKARLFFTLFEKDHWDRNDFDVLLREGLFVAEVLHPDRKNSSGKPPPPSALHYPEFFQKIGLGLAAVVERARSPERLLLKMAATCQVMVKKAFEEAEKIGFDQFLVLMNEAVKNPRFVDKVRKSFQAAIIDEFQDTDPLQWRIFETLFLKQGGWGYLYLVGDPKQSIYAFRQADIYTYLMAADAMGEGYHASLDTNYRSHRPLIEALNLLFSSESSPGLIQLPRLQRELDYHPVFAGVTDEKRFSDDLGSLHFSLIPTESKRGKIAIEEAETTYLFPYICEEIKRLHCADKIAYKEFAVLVSDRFQGQRVAEFLKKNRIPVITQRSSSLLESQALVAMQELLRAILHPKDESALKIALGGGVIGWSRFEIKQLEDLNVLARLLCQCYELRDHLSEHGFALFFQRLMESRWLDGESLSERILSKERGGEFYADFCQIAAFLMEEEHRYNLSPETLLNKIDQLILKGDRDEERFKRARPLDEEAVQVLTLHASKGLEFEVVFPIGLLSRSKKVELILPIGEPPALQKVEPTSLEFARHCLEVDAEKIRQLYVAMTRAKYRLYLPVLMTHPGQMPDIGSASPMELFLARLDQPALSTSNGIDAGYLQALYQRIPGYNGEILKRFVERHRAQVSMTLALLEERRGQCTAEAEGGVVLDLQEPPSLPLLPQESSAIYSFTGITKGFSAEGVFAEQEAPHDFHAQEKTPFTLPAGKEIGVLLHKILELISYEAVAKTTTVEEILPLVRPFLVRSLFVEWESVIGEIVFHALKRDLLGDGVGLCQLSVESRYHELEFLYPNHDMIVVEGMEREGSFLKGVIDMVFLSGGKYYIVDWKSNWLGGGLEDYEEEKLAEAMKSHHYELQAEIYRVALQRYLRLVDPRPFEEIYGGAYYLFLRGMASRRGVIQTSR